MKNRYLKMICAVMCICISVIFLIGAAADPETAEIKKLLEQRTDIISNVLSGSITFEEGDKLLKKIESETLYSNDIEVLKQYTATDYSEILNMKIIKMEKTSNIYNRMSFKCVIEWTALDYDGIYTETVTYSIGVSKSGNQYKLISMEVCDQK